VQTKSDVRLIYVTTPTEEVAREISFKLLEERLVACVNIIPGMKSIYRWQGNIEFGDECVLIIKTIERNTQAILEMLAQLHPYEVPCGLVINIESGLGPFRNWLAEESK
jgi:periplasmic divalent cation tolerance protein